MLAWTTPSTICQFAVPTWLKLLRSLPLNSVTQPVPGLGGEREQRERDDGQTFHDTSCSY